MASDGISYIGLAFLTFQATFQTILICLIGYFSAKSGLLPKQAQKYLSHLNIDIFTPCLIFIKLASKLSLSVLVDVSVIPMLFVFSAIVTYGTAKLTSRIFQFNRRESNFVTAMAVFGNTSSLPVSVVLALAYTLPGLQWDQIPDDNGESIASRGILYLVIYQQLALILRWSWGYNTLLAKPTPQELEQEAFGGRILEHEPATSSETDSLLAESRKVGTPNYTLQESTTLPLAYSSTSSLESLQESSEPFADQKSVFHKAFKWFMGIMNPPLWAILASLIVALIPPLKYEIMLKGGFVQQTFTGAIHQVSNTAVPLVLIVLGASLIPDDTSSSVLSSKHYNKLIIGSLLSRIFLPAVVILPTVAVCAKYMTLFPILKDPCFLLVAFILTITPPAVQLSQICQINKVFEKEMAGILFWGYVVVILPVIIVTVVLVSQVTEWIQ